MSSLTASLEGKKIIVTGGTRGIGKAVVEMLLQQGAKVAFTHTGSADPKVTEWLKKIEADFSGRAKAFVLNLSQCASFKEGVSAMCDFLGGLDGLVNNAGIARDQLMLRMKEEDFDATLDVNLKGSYFLTKEALRFLLKSEAPSVVFVGSIVGLMGNAGQTAYGASKAGLVGLAKSMAREMASRQLRVNVIAPGFIETDMTLALDEAKRKAFMGDIPFGRFGLGSEVAQGVAFLLSDMSRYVTGQVLNISGGLYI